MLTPLLPVITKGEAKTSLFPWYVYPPVETFVARMQAETVGRTATFFFAIRVTILVALPTCSLAGLQPHGLHYAAGL